MMATPNFVFTNFNFLVRRPVASSVATISISNQLLKMETNSHNTLG